MSYNATRARSTPDHDDDRAHLSLALITLFFVFLLGRHGEKYGTPYCFIMYMFKGIYLYMYTEEYMVGSTTKIINEARKAISLD